MKTMNDFVAAFHRHQTEVAALFSLMEREVADKEEQNAALRIENAELQKRLKETQPPAGVLEG